MLLLLLTVLISVVGLARQLHTPPLLLPCRTDLRRGGSELAAEEVRCEGVVAGADHKPAGRAGATQDPQLVAALHFCHKMVRAIAADRATERMPFVESARYLVPELFLELEHVVPPFISGKEIVFRIGYEIADQDAARPVAQRGTAGERVGAGNRADPCSGADEPREFLRKRGQPEPARVQRHEQRQPGLEQRRGFPGFVLVVLRRAGKLRNLLRVESGQKGVGGRLAMDVGGGVESSLEGGPGLGGGGLVSVIGDEDEGGLEVTEGAGEFGLVFELGGKGVKHGEDETTGGGTNTGGSPHPFSWVARKHCRFWHAGVHRFFFDRPGVARERHHPATRWVPSGNQMRCRRHRKPVAGAWRHHRIRAQKGPSPRRGDRGVGLLTDAPFASTLLARPPGVHRSFFRQTGGGA